MHVGFAGLGHMGLPMATRLAAHGFPLTVWNRTASRASPLAGRGIPVAGSPRELAAASNVIITMLADGAAVHAIWCGPDGLLAGCRDSCIAVDMSTIGPQAAREMAAGSAYNPFVRLPLCALRCAKAAARYRGTLLAVRHVLAQVSCSNRASTRC